MVNFSDKPQFTLKEIIYVIGAVFAIGGTQALDSYNDNIFKAEIREFVAVQQQDNRYSWEAVNEIKNAKKVDELSLRKLELDVTRILTEIKK